MADWQDLLAGCVRELEAGASPDQARMMLKIIRGYETRVRHLVWTTGLLAAYQGQSHEGGG